LFSNQDKFRYRRNTNDETASLPSAITPAKGKSPAPSLDSLTPYTYQRKVTQRSREGDATPVKGNIADIRDLVQSVGSKATNLSNHVNLDWMMQLRNRNNLDSKSRGGLSNLTAEGSQRNINSRSGSRERTSYSPEKVPNVYYKETENLKRQLIKQYEYKGNFQDI